PHNRFSCVYTLNSLYSYNIYLPPNFFFFFFNDPATTEIYTLSLHDALPIFNGLHLDHRDDHDAGQQNAKATEAGDQPASDVGRRSEEHTSELQSPYDLVCRLLLEKKKKKKKKIISNINNIMNINVYHEILKI